jgi:hypothetical protein
VSLILSYCTLDDLHRQSLHERRFVASKIKHDFTVLHPKSFVLNGWRLAGKSCAQHIANKPEAAAALSDLSDLI